MPARDQISPTMRMRIAQNMLYSGQSGRRICQGKQALRCPNVFKIWNDEKNNQVKKLSRFQTFPLWPDNWDFMAKMQEKNGYRREEYM